jgi:glycosyltransferase involved in cell wall biosynthesis
LNARGHDVRLSVVIPCRNGAATLAAQLECLAAQDWSEPWEVVVADNGSTDGTAEVVERFRERMPNLRLADASARVGINHARNAGAEAAQGDLLAFCDDDDEVQPGWLAAMGDALLEHELVAGRLDVDRLNDSWVIAVRGRPQSEGLAAFDGQLSYAAGCNLGIRRELHERIGGFDESFLGGAEDVDYSWRAQEAGAALHFQPSALVAYRLKPTLSGTFRQARSYAVGYVSLFARHELPRQRHVWIAALVSWAGIVKYLPPAVTRTGRARFLWQLGWKLGLLEGSIKNRLLVLSARGLPVARAGSPEGGPAARARPRRKGSEAIVSNESD